MGEKQLEYQLISCQEQENPEGKISSIYLKLQEKNVSTQNSISSKILFGIKGEIKIFR